MQTADFAPGAATKLSFEVRPVPQRGELDETCVISDSAHSLYYVKA